MGTETSSSAGRQQWGPCSEYVHTFLSPSRRGEESQAERSRSARAASRSGKSLLTGSDAGREEGDQGPHYGAPGTGVERIRTDPPRVDFLAAPSAACFASSVGRAERRQLVESEASPERHND